MVLHDSDGKNHCHKNHLLLAIRPSHQTHSMEKLVSLHKFRMYNHVYLSTSNKAKQYYSLIAILDTEIKICTCTLVIKGSAAAVEFPSKGC